MDDEFNELMSGKFQKDKSSNRTSENISKLTFKLTEIEGPGEGLGKKKGITQQQLNKFAKLCNDSTDAVLDSSELQTCGKLGSWKNRAGHLLNDIEIMRNVCKNQPKQNTGY